MKELELKKLEIQILKNIADTLLTNKKLFWFEATMLFGAVGIGIALAKLFL